ncbi:MAG: nitroreductase family protein [Flavobacteriales bacterium]|nr:nitroreductase family protein [Flavobacteriales bacterium]MCB9448138.1 nitroreductase family protein [Flavobacteriales bacterium]
MEHPFITYTRDTYSPEEMIERSASFYEWMDTRRSVRHFSDREVPREVMENIIKTASTAPSGAHKQPWTFCLIGDPAIKKAIREAAEKEEYESYNGRMTEEWLQDLAPLQTDWHKEFLEVAPWIVVLFKRVYENVDGKKKNNYYVSESVGLAAGFFLAAVHNAGLVSLTHTPSPMNFLAKILNRPDNERPFLLLPVGYPADDVQVPDLVRKPLSEVMETYL